MKPLRPLSARPKLVVDPAARGIFDPSTDTRVGREGPWGRERIVFALPINGTGPVTLAAPIVVHDQDGFYLADPDGTLLGVDGVRVSRFLNARWTEDTRRLSG